MNIINRINILYLIIFLCIIGNLLLLDNYHQWGDDFSLYLNQAKSLTNASYNDLFIRNKDIMDHGKAGPYLYPIGYPILIAPIFYLPEFNFIYFKLFNFTVFLFGLYFFYRITVLLKIKKEISLITILTLLLSPIFFWHHNNIVSDIPSLTLSLICIYLYLKLINTNIDGSVKYLNFLILSFLIAYTIFTRTANISLMFSMIVISFIKLVLIEKKIKIFLLHFIYLTFITIIFFMLNLSFHLNRGDNEMKVLLNTNVFETIKHHLPYYIEIITDPFTVLLNPFVKYILDHTLFFNYKEYAKLISIIISCFIFIYFIRRYILKRGYINVFCSLNELFIAIVLISTIGIYTIWPSTQGHRFVFLIYPFLFLFLYCQVMKLPKKINKLFFIIIVFLMCFDGITSLKFNLFTTNNLENINEIEGRPGSKDFNKMIVYIKDSVKVSSNQVIGTNKPRLINFFTNKKAYLYNHQTSHTFQYLFVRESEPEDNTILHHSHYFLKRKIGKLLLLEKTDFSIIK